MSMSGPGKPNKYQDYSDTMIGGDTCRRLHEEVHSETGYAGRNRRLHIVLE